MAGIGDSGRQSQLVETRAAFPLVVSLGATIGMVLLLLLNPVTDRVYATDMFGALREPGQPAFVAGHRGDRSTAPENTIPALQAAIDSSMEYIETDVMLSSDGIPVLFHDVTLDRTTDGSGAVAAKTLAELKALDAGSWYSSDYAGVRIPTLDEFLDILEPSSKKALIELKGSWTPEQFENIAELVGRRALAGRVVYMSFDLGSLESAAEIAPSYPRVAIMSALPKDVVDFARSFQVIGIVASVHAIESRPDAVDDMHEAGYGIMVYTLNSTKRWNHALELGVDGIITDKPSTLDAWLARTAPGT